VSKVCDCSLNFSVSKQTRLNCRSATASVLYGLENRIDGLRRQILVIDVVDHHHRRAAASRETFFLDLQVELAVGRALPGPDAEPLLDVGEDVVAAAQHAGNVRADRDAVPT